MQTHGLQWTVFGGARCTCLSASLEKANILLGVFRENVARLARPFVDAQNDGRIRGASGGNPWDDGVHHDVASPRNFAGRARRILENALVSRLGTFRHGELRRHVCALFRYARECNSALLLLV